MTASELGGARGGSTTAAEMQGAFGYVDSTVRRAFEDIDTDGSGKLSQRELSGALQPPRHYSTVHTEGELYSHMERWDQDEDGRLNATCTSPLA